MYCKQCGNLIDVQSKFCPYCGKECVDAPSSSNPKQLECHSSTNVLAIVGFVISLISLLLNFWGLVGIAAVIVSVLGLLKAEKYNGNGKTMAIIGTVIGGASVFYGFISIL